MRRWPIALPLYESPDISGDAGGAAVVEAPATSDEGGSLSDHEASFSPEAQSQPVEDSPAEGSRDETGRFKPRHRSKSQQAAPGDVPRIADLTKKWRTTEAERDAIKAERETIARERDELKARLDRPAAAQEQPPAKSPGPAPVGDKFPTYDVWFEKPENADKTWDDYSDARTAHTYAMLRAQERQEEAARESQKSYADIVRVYREHETAIRSEIPDYDTVLNALGPRDVSAAVERAVMSLGPLGPRVAYYLATHPETLREYTMDTLVDPDNPAFPAIVAMTKRHLSTLVASEQRSTPSTRSAAARPDQPLASVRPPAPRPPNPVRTGSIAEPDTPPDPDDQSLSSHEKHYGRKYR